MAKSLEKNFIESLGDFMEAHKMADWAVVARAVDSTSHSSWVAGTGKDTISDRERTNFLHGEMARLQLDMLVRTMPSVPK